MIHVHAYPECFNLSRRDDSEDAHASSPISALIPEGWTREFTIAFLNGAKSGIDDIAHSGDHVSLVLAPSAQLPFIAQVFLLVFFSAASVALAPKLLKPTATGDDSSPLYSFGGVTGSRTPGQPIPSYYGKILAGGQVINEYVDSQAQNGNWYNVLICYGYGPIKSIGGITQDTTPDQPLRSPSVPRTIFINGTPATEYEGVEVHVRLGTSEQAAIPGFDRDNIVAALLLALSAPEGTVTTFDPFVSITTPSPSEDPLWVTYGVEHDFIGDGIEAFTVKIRAARGFYYVDSGNNTSPLAMSIAVRYIELDGSDLPIATGGPDGDGYVRLRPTQRRNLAIAEDFSIDFPFKTYDPQTFTMPTLGGVLNANGSYEDHSPPYAAGPNAYASRAAASVVTPSAWVSGAPPEMSCFAWVALRPNGARYGASTPEAAPSIADLDDFAPVLSWLNTTWPGGFELALADRVFVLSPGQTRSRITPIVSLAGAGGVKTYFPRNPTGQTGGTATEIGDVPFRIGLSQNGDVASAEWNHVGFTYRADADGVNDRLRIYVNGEIVMELLASIPIRLPSGGNTANLRLCASSLTSGVTGRNQLKGWLDEVFVSVDELSQQEVEDVYSGGVGRSVQGSASSRFCTFAFEESPPGGVTGDAQTIDDSGSLNNSLTTVLNGAPPGVLSSGASKGFIDLDVPTNTIKRSKYRVEVMRATRDFVLATGSDDLVLESLTGHIEAGFTYPEAALLALRVRAQDQLSGGPPEVTSVIEGAIIKVWDGTDITNPNLPAIYSQNPAWIAYDLCTNARRGMGSRLSEGDVDLVSVAEWAAYNDEWVYDLRGHELPILGSDPTNSVYDIIYTQSGGEVTSLWLQFGSVFVGSIPDNYRVGGYIGLNDVPGPGASVNVLLDINEPVSGGWLILSIDDGRVTGEPRIYLDYSVVDRGVPLPWTIADSLSTALALTSVALTGSAHGVERRNRFDGGFDEASGGWDTLIAIADTAGAFPMRVGQRVFFFVDQPRPTTDLVTMSNTIDGTFEIDYSGPADRPNAMLVEILDEEKLYERAPVYDEHPSVNGTAALSEIRSASAQLRGVVRRSQAARWIRERLNRNQLIRRSGRYTASADALPHEPGTALLVSNDLVPRGIGGRVLAGSTTTSILLARPLTLSVSVTTYSLSIRGALSATVDGYETKTVTNAAGSYDGTLGEAITVSSPFSFTPAAGDVFLLTADGNELRVLVRGIGLTQGLQREVAWSEYNEDVYIVDGTELEDLAGETLAATDSAGAVDAGESAVRRLPPRVERLSAREITVRSSGGTQISGAVVSWEPLTPPPTIAHQVVWLRVNNGEWREAARVSASATSCSVTVPSARSGVVWSFSVTPVSSGGSAREPSRAGSVSLRAVGHGPTPTAPTDLRPLMQGDQGVYLWATPDSLENVTFDLRRGGWILGQPIASSPHGSRRLGPTDDFTTVTQTSIVGFQAGAPIFLRARNGHNRWSAHALAYWAPRTINDVSFADVDDELFVSQEWRELYGGWHSVAPITPNATLTDLEVDTDGTLHFSGSATTGSYLTALPITQVNQRAEDVYVSAFASADQVSTTTWEECSFSWGDERATQLSFEGALNTLGDGEDVACSLEIWVRFLDADNVWSSWRNYKPSRAVCIAVQFELQATRPTDGWDIRIHRFSTQLVRASATKYDRDDHQHILQQRGFRRG